AQIDNETVAEEIDTLRYLWQPDDNKTNNHLSLLPSYLSPKQMDNMDLMERHELAITISVCLNSGSAAEAGRTLYSVSRLARKKPNDGARVIAMLGKHGLKFEDL
ncbi:MAG: hypothetical protein MI867_16615, partial [Pseudomonadales bacterium]|nr:hypothetical protein [Pseudomonadales bacterium]